MGRREESRLSRLAKDCRTGPGVKTSSSKATLPVVVGWRLGVPPPLSPNNIVRPQLNFLKKNSKFWFLVDEMEWERWKGVKGR
jgi:hypothetical protein